MPINLCKLLGWKFTSVLNFLEFQSNHKEALNLIDNLVKPELDKLATKTLEEVRLNLKYITNKKVKEKLESSGLIFAVDHARYLAKQVNRLIRPKNLGSQKSTYIGGLDFLDFSQMSKLYKFDFLDFLDTPLSKGKTVK